MAAVLLPDQVRFTGADPCSWPASRAFCPTSRKLSCWHPSRVEV